MGKDCIIKKFLLFDHNATNKRKCEKTKSLHASLWQNMGWTKWNLTPCTNCLITSWWKVHWKTSSIAPITSQVLQPKVKNLLKWNRSPANLDHLCKNHSPANPSSIVTIWLERNNRIFKDSSRNLGWYSCWFLEP